MALALCLVPKILLPQSVARRGYYQFTVPAEVAIDGRSPTLLMIKENCRNSTRRKFIGQGFEMSRDEECSIGYIDDDFAQNRVTFVYRFDLVEI